MEKVEIKSNMQSYVVQRGDTLIQISKKFNTRPIDIIKRNNIPKGLNTIPEGMKLEISNTLSYLC